MDEIFAESRDKILKWTSLECGTLSNSKKLFRAKQEIPVLSMMSDQQILNHLREEQLAAILSQEVSSLL